MLDSWSEGQLPSPVYLVLILSLSIRKLGYDRFVSAAILPFVAVQKSLHMQL
jgi:hypothetical protein